MKFSALSLIAIASTFGLGESTDRALQDPVATNGEKACLAKADVEARIQSFASGVPVISAAYWDNGGTGASRGPHDEEGGETMEACKAAYDIALGYIESAYGYPEQVLFDPTLTSEPYRFRPTKAGALSYFLGTKCLNMVGEIQFPDNNSEGTEFFEYGFGLKNKPAPGNEGWCDVTWNTDDFYYNIDDNEFCHTVVALGQMCFIKCADGKPSCVDKTFTFNAANEGQEGVVFMGHHSSLSVGYVSDDTSLVCQTAEPLKDCPKTFEESHDSHDEEHSHSHDSHDEEHSHSEESGASTAATGVAVAAVVGSILMA